MKNIILISLLFLNTCPVFYGKENPFKETLALRETYFSAVIDSLDWEAEVPTGTLDDATMTGRTSYIISEGDYRISPFTIVLSHPGADRWHLDKVSYRLDGIRYEIDDEESPYKFMILIHEETERYIAGTFKCVLTNPDRDKYIPVEKGKFGVYY